MAELVIQHRLIRDDTQCQLKTSMQTLIRFGFDGYFARQCVQFWVFLSIGAGIFFVPSSLLTTLAFTSSAHTLDKTHDANENNAQQSTATTNGKEISERIPQTTLLSRNND